MIQINDRRATWFSYLKSSRNFKSLAKSVRLYAMAGIIIARYARYTTRYFIFIMKSSFIFSDTF